MNIVAHDVRNHNTHQACKKQAEKKEIVWLTKSGYKKYTYCNVNRPTCYLAPPIPGNILYHINVNLVANIPMDIVNLINGYMLL